MKVIILIQTLFICVWSLVACGQEHSSNKRQNIKQLTVTELSAGVTTYVKKEQKQNNGYYTVYDSVAKKLLKLQLDKIHDDRLAHVGNNNYFVCADFKGDDGRLYDIDVFMKWDGKELTPMERKVHKVNSVPRYDWYKDGDTWKTKPGGKKKNEHPTSEHPNSEHPKSEHPKQ